MDRSGTYLIESPFCQIRRRELARMEDITLYHKVKRSRGGSDHLDNPQLAHETRNSEKGTVTPEEWEEFQRGASVGV
jgi:hypothetical protein